MSSTAFWVDFTPPSLKYSYVLHVQFGVSKPVIIIDSCVVKSWFIFANLQIVSQAAMAKNIIFRIVFCFWMTTSSLHNCTLKQHSMSTLQIFKRKISEPQVRMALECLYMGQNETGASTLFSSEIRTSWFYLPSVLVIKLI